MNKTNRLPPMPTVPPGGACRWCGEALLYAAHHPKAGQPIPFRSWHYRTDRDCLSAYWLATASVTQRFRLRVRDQGICACCGVDASRSGWEADHIKPLWSLPAEVPLSERDRWWGLANLQTLCVSCHKGKSRREAAERARLRRLSSAPLVCQATT